MVSLVFICKSFHRQNNRFLMFISSYHRTFQEYEPWKGQQAMIRRQAKPILERNRLHYFANEYKTTFDISYSSKLMKKYNLSTNIIHVNRCLAIQQPFNLRRLHQLYLNIARYEYVHYATVFNYDFLRVLFLCGEFNVNHFLYQFTMMNFDGSGETRFLLKQFEISLDLINQYPNNLSFELVYRLYPFRDYLPKFLSNLLDQCLDQCPLVLITDDQRPQYLMKCSVSTIIYSKISPFSLIIVTNDNKIYRFDNHFQSKVEQSDIVYKKKTKDEKLISAAYESKCLCCLTSNSQIVTNESTLRNNSCNRLISMIKKGIILIIESSNHVLQIWDCLANSLLSKYDFDDDIIEDCFWKKPMIKISLKLSQTIVYLLIDDNHQLKLIRTICQHRMNHQHRILLDLDAEFFYSFDRSTASLIVYDQTNSTEIYNDIDFISRPKSVFYLSNSNSIAWLTDTSLRICNPLYKQKIFQPFDLIISNDTIEYDIVHDNYSSVAFSCGLANLLACIVKSKGIVDIYEWFYDKKEQKHVSYLLCHVKLDIYIEYCIFEVGM